jgi:hypothetical protein
MRHSKSIAGALAVISLSLAVPLLAQNSIPRLPNGKPDFSGVWEHPFVPDMEVNTANQQGAGPLPFTTEGAAIFKKYDAGKFDYTGRCLPMGLTRLMNSPFPIQIMETNKEVAFLFEAWSTFHVVPLDGRKHPDDLEPQWNGLSNGHWEGDTLIIESDHFNDRSNLDTVGHPHSNQLRVVQRFTRTDDKHLTYEITINDPKMFTKPWKNVRTFTLRPDWELLEYSCEENNRDFAGGHIK